MSLMRELRSVAEELSSYADLMDNSARAMEDLLRDNEKLKAASVQQWISVEEKLPEPGMRVIIARPYEPGQPLRVEQGCYSTNGWWKVYGTNVKRVKYWMPMPEPPEVA